MGQRADSVTDLATSGDDAERDADPSYAYKPNLAGAPLMLWLRRDGLEWNTGRRSGLVRYDRIRRVRLSFRPATMQSYRFIAELWAPEAPKILIASTSWQGITMQQRLDAPYVAFISELHRRLAAVGSKARFQIGMPSVAYWVGLVVVTATTLSFVMLMIRAMQSDDWRATAVVGAIFAVFVWQIGNFFIRNRPGFYRPELIPPQVLPRT